MCELNLPGLFWFSVKSAYPETETKGIGDWRLATGDPCITSVFGPVVK